MYHDCIMTLPTFKKKGNCRVVVHFRAEMVKWHETKERNESVKPRRTNTNARKEKKLKNTYDIRGGASKRRKKRKEHVKHAMQKMLCEKLQGVTV